MKPLKSAYVQAVHKLAVLGPAERYCATAREADAHSLSRWLASLLAIHDTSRMIDLDCPWWNVAATSRIDQFLKAKPGSRVFEWGSGASTVWVSRRSREIVSVEHDSAWFARLDREIGDRESVTTLLHRDLENDGRDYIGAIEECGGSFDLIVIDGRQRARCLEKAVEHLAPGGVVLFDDSGRRRYRAAIAGCGLAELVYFGRSYCVPYPDHTSILFRNG
jgi:SAM-dependent methyltransferase